MKSNKTKISDTRIWLIKELCDPYYNISKTKLEKIFQVSRRQIGRIQSEK